MFKRYWYVVLIVLFIIGLIVYFTTLEPMVKKSYEIPHTFEFVNTTSFHEVDTIVYVGTRYIIGKDSLKMNILSNKRFFSKNPEYEAILEKYPSHYNLHLSHKLDSREISTVVAHELVHLDQYLKNRLIIKEDSILFNGKIYSAELPYKERPWEQEAFEKQDSMRIKLNELLYEKKN